MAKVYILLYYFRRLYVGISAATGQLADNHDILAFNVYDGTDDLNSLPDIDKIRLEKEIEEQESQFDQEVKKAGGDIEKLNPIEIALHKQITQLEVSTENKLNDLEHHLEHQLTGILLFIYSCS